MLSLSWVACDGGPHILLPSEVAGTWSGTQVPGNGRAVNAKFRWNGDLSEPASDYDAACDINELAGLVQVGTYQGLVLGDDVPMSTWVPSNQFSGGVLVVPMEWPDTTQDEGHLLSAIASVPESEFSETGLTLPTSSGEFLLCAACDRGPSWVYPTQKVSLSPASFRVITAETRTHGYWLRLHALQSAT